MIANALAGLFRRDIDWQDWMARWPFPWGPGTWDTYTGKVVTPDTALTHSTVFACVRIIAETIAGMPKVIIREAPQGSRVVKLRDRGHPMWSIFHDAPNSEMTSVEFFESMCGQMALRGNAYANIQPLNNGGSWLWPLRTDKMDVVREQETQKLVYVYTLPSGEQRRLSRDEVWHLKAFGDGMMGYSPIQVARHAIELGLAAEEYGARFFGNGSKPGGLLTSDQTLTDAAIKRMRDQWDDLHRGMTGAHRVAVLEQGVKWQNVQLMPEDAQFLQTRKFQRADIAAFFRVPPHMVGDLERATYSNIEQQSLEFVTYTLLNWLTRIESSAKMKFLSDTPDRSLKFLVQALLRGDTESRFKAYAIGRQWGWLSPDDVRELEDQNPIGPEHGGDTYLAPVNMVPAEQLGQLADSGALAGVDGVQGSSAAAGETREGNGSVESRRRTTAAYTKIFRDTAQRAVNREVRDLRRLVEKHLTRRDAQDFAEAVQEYYAEFEPALRLIWAPAVTSLAEVVSHDAAAEVGQQPDAAHIQRFAQNYLAALVAAYVRRSQNQVEYVLKNNDGDLAAAVNTRLDSWAQARAERTAGAETNRLVNATARETWIRAGTLRIAWKSYGSKNCEFCQGLNGQVVGIQHTFINAGEALQADGQSAPLHPTSNIYHPPAHGGCECMVSPGR